MGAEFAFKFFLLYLVLVMCVDGKGGARDDSQSEGMHGEPVHVHDHPASHMDHMDHSLLVFFTLNDLKVGRTMPIYFPKKDPSKSPRLLPREDANSIPFSYEKFPYLLQFFSFSNGSPQAIAMEDTLRACEIKPIKGEVKFCATSLESMLDFVQGILGLESRFKVVSTTYLTESSILLQNYTILEVPKEVPAPKMVACHTMTYPYAVFYCHSQGTKNKVFMVSLIGENGDRVEALAVCHLDTSQWSRNHVSFKVLGIEPGSSDVCHFFPEDNLVYVPMPTMSNNLINVM
uniref:BURP domain-containing protein n=1 Tax=Populus trichocarpa TaxID=3694 RepID=B9HRP5_POPTR|eukprot:XP_002313054.2 BURP domain-containing protein BNM2A [Populus trichocarpa]